jgi:hypothetical protein
LLMIKKIFVFYLRSDIFQLRTLNPLWPMYDNFLVFVILCNYLFTAGTAWWQHSANLLTLTCMRVVAGNEPYLKKTVSHFSMDESLFINLVPWGPESNDWMWLGHVPGTLKSLATINMEYKPMLAVIWQGHCHLVDVIRNLTDLHLEDMFLIFWQCVKETCTYHCMSKYLQLTITGTLTSGMLSLLDWRCTPQLKTIIIRFFLQVLHPTFVLFSLLDAYLQFRMR